MEPDKNAIESMLRLRILERLQTSQLKEMAIASIFTDNILY